MGPGGEKSKRTLTDVSRRLSVSLALIAPFIQLSGCGAGGGHQFIRAGALLQVRALMSLASYGPDSFQSTINHVKYMLRRPFVCDVSPRSAPGARDSSPASKATSISLVFHFRLKDQRFSSMSPSAGGWQHSLTVLHIQGTRFAPVNIVFVLVWIRIRPDQCVLGHYLGNIPQ